MSAARGEALRAIYRQRTDCSIDRVAHYTADHRPRLDWKSHCQGGRPRGSVRGVGPLGVPGAAFASRFHGDHGLRVQLRTVPMDTGMTSLTSTVNR
jgi:hypothetical protein